MGMMTEYYHYIFTTLVRMDLYVLEHIQNHSDIHKIICISGHYIP